MLVSAILNGRRFSKFQFANSLQWTIALVGHTGAGKSSIAVNLPLYEFREGRIGLMSRYSLMIWQATGIN
jgi:ABC-type multidrug transport system fused ATPase/permease subunit